MKYVKNIEKTTNKILIPKCYVKKYGYMVYMEIQEDGTIIIKPVKKP